MELMRRLGSVERTWKMIGGAVAALTLVFTAVAVSGSSAEAAEPTAVRVLEHTLPATDFNILCEGETNEDPSVSGPDAFPDLTSVSGARLAAYNEGELVVLYTAEGLGRFAYPPLCAVRHVDGVGAVAEWMFCTDMFANVCGDIRDDGLLMENEDPPRVLQQPM